MAEHATVVDVSRYYAADGKRDELTEAMRRIAREAAGSPGCFGAQVCTSKGDPEALVAISRWESAQALDAFSESPAFVREREQLAGLLARPAERERFSS